MQQHVGFFMCKPYPLHKTVCFAQIIGIQPGNPCPPGTCNSNVERIRQAGIFFLMTTIRRFLSQ
jgi:hypothetical protein